MRIEVSDTGYGDELVQPTVKRSSRSLVTLSESAPSFTRLFELPEKAVIGDRKLWLSVVLQAIAETDSQYVVTNRAKKDRASFKAKAVREAREYVASDAFSDACVLAGMRPSFARSLSAQQAHDALRVLQDNSSEELVQDFEAQLAKDDIDAD